MLLSGASAQSLSGVGVRHALSERHLVPVCCERKPRQRPDAPQANKPPHAHTKAGRRIVYCQLLTIGVEPHREVIFDKGAGWDPSQGVLALCGDLPRASRGSPR